MKRIILECQLTEEFKWGVPCYSFQKSNIVLIRGFKEYCAILFVKGSLLKDAGGLLIRQTENVQAGRQIRFTGVNDIIALEPVLKAYIQEAIEVERAGLEVDFKKNTEYKIPEEHISCISPILNSPRHGQQESKNASRRFCLAMD